MTILSIPDMTCGHCRASVEAALAPLAAKVAVDLPARQVTVEGAAEPARLIAALSEVGFDAKIVTA